jgi:predicted RNA-binding protein with PIN domain
MAYLIDGNNFLGFWLGAARRDPSARASLVGRLEAFARQTRKRVILVFDGAPADDLLGSGSEKFALVFPPEGETADALIKDRIIRSSDRRYLVVVSSDREIRDFARAHGATSLPCDVFAKELKKALRERRDARSLEKRDEASSPLEVELWAKAFGRGR